MVSMASPAYDCSSSVRSSLESSRGKAGGGGPPAPAPPAQLPARRSASEPGAGPALPGGALAVPGETPVGAMAAPGEDTLLPFKGVPVAGAVAQTAVPAAVTTAATQPSLLTLPAVAPAPIPTITAPAPAAGNAPAAPAQAPAVAAPQALNTPAPAVEPLRAGREAAEDAPRILSASGGATAVSARPQTRSGAASSDAGSTSASPSAPQGSQSTASAATQPVSTAPVAAAPVLSDAAAGIDADLAPLDLAGGEFAQGAPAEARNTAAAAAAAPSGAAPRWTAHTTAHLAVQMARRAEAGVTNFAIRLDPAELGRIEVRLSIGADQKVRASLTVERPETLAEVMRASRDLVDALADAGLSLEDGALSVSLDDRSPRRGAPDREASAAKTAAASAPDAEAAPSVPPAAERWSRGRIDLSL